MSVLAALMVLTVQAAAQETRVPITNLLGLTAEEVAAATGASPAVVAGDGVRIVEGGRILDLYPVRRFWRQPTREDEGCLTGFEDAPAGGDSVERRRALAQRTGGLLVFENGRLSAVYPDALPPPSAPRREGATARDLRTQLQGPRPLSPLVVVAGRLPLSDGAAALGRMQPAPAAAALVSLCMSTPPTRYRSDPGTDVIWGLVGLPVLPLVPFQQAEDARAEREGGALLASVEAGESLGAVPEAWVGRVRGVRVYRDPADPDFAVIAVRLGSGEDTVARVGLLGVRGDRVVWKAGGAAADQSGLRALVCRDAANRATNARRGCSTTGFLIP